MAKIPIILEPGRADGKLVTSDSIFDKNKNKFQNKINQEVEERLNDVKDTLNSDSTTTPLSAKQGKILKNLLDSKVIEIGSIPIDSEPILGNTTHIVNSDGLAKEFNKCNTTIINTDRIANEAIVPSKLSTDIQSLISNLSKTATFAGIATPTTNPGTPDGHVFYIANGKGIYTNFGGIDVTEDEVIILYYDNIWHKEVTGIASNDKVTELEKQINGKEYAKSNELITSGGGKNYDDILLDAGREYIVSITESTLNLEYHPMYMFCNADALADGVSIISIGTEHTFTPKNTGVLRVASGSRSDNTISFKVKDSQSLTFDIKSKIPYSDIVDNVTSNDTNKPLSARQGKILNDTIVGESYLSDEIAVSMWGGTNISYVVKAGTKYKISVVDIDVQVFTIWGFSVNDPITNRVTITEANKYYELTPQNDGVIRLGDGNGSGPYNFTIKIDTVSIKDDIQELEEAVEVQKDRIAKLDSPNVIIKKISNTAFDVHVKSASCDKYLIHEFRYDTYTRDMSPYGGSASQVCGDLWDVGGIKNEDGNYILAGNLNMIYMLDSSVEGFENENLHVGMGGGQSGAHGLEVREFTKFFADGVEFEPLSMPDDIKCRTFRILQKSKCYAADSSISAVNSNNYPKLQGGQPIVTAEHFIDVEYSVDNEIKWRNRLVIRRDHVKFNQCHGAMVAIKLDYFKNVVINDDKTSQNTYENIEGEFVETQVGDSNPLNKQEYRADEVISFGKGYTIHQRMCQDDGSRYKNSFIQSNNNNNPTEMKFYMMPVICGTNGSGEEFNFGDEISVTNVRKIDFVI